MQSASDSAQNASSAPSRRWWQQYAFLLGLSIRLFLAWALPLLLDDAKWIPGVAYTDIDYQVFTDAARHVAQGRSPYERHTYRYTPFLAAFLSFLPKEGGRHLFCIADAICGLLIVRLRRSERKNECSNVTVVDLLWWMYNPFAINICTRGSAESFMVLLPVLLTVILVQSKSTIPLLPRACLAGTVHGVAIHSKLYPIIYTLSYMAYFATIKEQEQTKATNNASFPWTDTERLSSLIQTWVRRLLHPAPLLFLVTSMASFASLTYVAVLWYGEESLKEGLLYHLSRVDHRHNYSIFWYPIYLYLARARLDVGMTLVGRILMIPQFVLLVYSSLGIAPYDLGLALFTQTYLFVALNKVITAQYFTWYLCLLPLCRGFDYWKTRGSFLLVGISIVMWLASAYCLEMKGMVVHRQVWCASLLYFAANIHLLGALLRSYSYTTQATAHPKGD